MGALQTKIFMGFLFSLICWVMLFFSQISAGQDAGDQSGLQSKFFMPTSTTSMLQDSNAISTPTLEGSTFNVEDIFKSGAEAPPGGSRGKQGNEARLDASGFNAEDVTENPFEVCT